MGDITYISGQDIERIHDDLLEATGTGLECVLKQGYAGYVMHVAEHYVSGDLPDKAGFIMARIAKGHAFNDANKRTAYFATRFFLMQNSADLDGDNVESTIDQVYAVAAADTMEAAERVAIDYCRAEIITGLQPLDYERFSDLVIKSIAVAKALSTM